MVTARGGILRVFLFWALPATLVLVGGVALLIMLREYVLHAPAFHVKKVEVLTEGPARKADLIRLAAIPRETSLFALSLSQIRERVEQDSWVASASVSRVLPDKVLIRYIPQTPVAILNAGEMFYVNASGEVFHRIQMGESLDFPLLNVPAQIKGPQEISQATLQAALTLLELMDKSVLIGLESLSELLLMPEGAQDGVLLRLKLKAPPIHAASKKSPNPLIQLNFASHQVETQFRRAETVLKHLNASKKTAKLVRLELGKKVVVKINQ